MDSCAHRPHGSSRLPIWAAFVAAVLFAVPAPAATALQSFHIDAGDATLTLNEFSRQSNLQLLFDYNVVRGRKTRAVSGDYELTAALRQMLAGTGLVFDFVNDRTLAVTLTEPEGPGSAIAPGPDRKPRGAHFAQTQSVFHETPGSGDPRAGANAPGIQEILVTGTHLRGAQPIGDPLISFDREAIDESGAATAADFLRTLPQAFGGGPSEDTHYFSRETQTNSGAGAGINLRGLGAGSTLVLMDGRRLAPSGDEGEFTDIENIPILAVQRMDILPDSATALYGADAVGGVVNFVMRDNFTGSESFARAGSGTGNTLREYQAAQTSGKRWDSGNAMLSVEFYKRDALPASARAYATSDLTQLGGSNFDTPMTNPGNVVVGNTTYALPHGQNGIGLAASQLVAGTRNLADSHAGSDLLPSQRRLSLYGSGRQALADGLTLFGNVLLSQREAVLKADGFGATLPVPSSNPFYVNPAGGTGPISVEYNFLKDLGPLYNDVIVKTVNMTLGASLDAGADWKLTLYTSYAQEKENQLIGGQVNLPALYAALGDPNPATAFNPFGDGSHSNPATLEAISRNSRFHADSRLRSVNVSADGPITKLPGGAIKLALGADRRNQVFDTITPADGVTPGSSVSLSRNVTSAYGEITVPLFGADNARRGLRRLDLSIAGRFEEFSDFGGSGSPKLGIVWSPFEQAALRGTWGRSIRTPTLSDRNTSQNLVVAYLLPDKASPAGYAPALIESGKYPGLAVEHARTWTAGVEFEPRDGPHGLNLSATYFDIDFRDRIDAPDLTTNLLNDPSLAYFVTRNPSPAQIAVACDRGQFIALSPVACGQFAAAAIVDLRYQNIASARTRGIDFRAAYQRDGPAGTLKLNLDGTYLMRFTELANPGGPTLELLNTQNNPVNLKMRGLLSWNRPRWGVTLGVNFQNSYEDTVSDPHRNIRSYTTLDTQLRYVPGGYGSGFLQNTRLELNAFNLFNASPPFLNNATARLGYDQENADPLGRLLSIQVRKAW